MNKSIIIYLFAFFVGCSQVNITPKVLENGNVGKDYIQKINIDGGIVNRHSIFIQTNFPHDMGLLISPSGKSETPYNEFTIQGKPNYKGKYEIKISGETHKGSGGGSFKKNYDLVILP